MINEETKFEWKGYTTKELTKLYKCSYKTWRTWIDPHKDKIGERRGHSYTIIQVRCIIDILGYPDLEAA